MSPGDGDQRRRDDPFRWVLDVSAMLMVAPGERESMQRIAQAVGEGMGASGADILSYDAARGALIQEASWDVNGVNEQDLAYLGTVIPLDESPMFKRMIDSRRVEESHFDDPGLPDDERAMFAEWGYKTTLDAPLLIGDELVGALGVTESRYERRFMSMEVERFGKFAAMSAAAVRNARVFHREREQSRRLELMMGLSDVLTAGNGSGTGLANGARALATGLGAAWVALYSMTSAGAVGPRLLSRQVTVTAPNGIHEDEADWLLGLRGVIQKREPLLALANGAGLANGTDTVLREEMVRRGESCRLCLPLVRRGETIGLLALGWRSKHAPPGPDDIAFAASAGDLLGIALENASLDGSLG